MHQTVRTAAGVIQTFAVALQLFVLAQRGKSALQNRRCMGLAWNRQPIVDPLPFPTRRHNSRPAQIRQVPRDLRLWRPDHLNEVADAQLLVRHQVDQAQARPVGKRAE